jgi:hypothetical protein
MPDIPREERLRLERAVIVAIQGLYVAENSACRPARIVERNAMPDWRFARALNSYYR